MIIKVTVNEEKKDEIRAYAEKIDRSVSNVMLRAINCYMKMHS